MAVCFKNLCFWSTVALFLVNACSVSGLTSDGVSLLSFKYSILSDPLSVLAAWNYDDVSPCSWDGVTCEQVGEARSTEMFRVTGLVLPSSQLLGSVSPDLGSIEHLRTLDLSDNFFNGSLPDSIFNATGLEVVALAGNAISGELSEKLGALRSLRILNLSDNAFSGKIPANLTSLTNLTVVSLRSNYFSGGVPAGADVIEVLDLSSNLLNGSLPLDFSGEKLRYLNVSYNRISGRIPARFAGKIPENATVDLSFNNLTGAIPATATMLNQKTEMFAGNRDLCGKPLKTICSIPSTISSPPNVTTTSPAIAVIPKQIDSTQIPDPPGTGSGSTSTQKQSNGLRPGTIAGIAAGDFAGISILAVIILYVYQIRKRNRNPVTNSSKKLETGTKPDPCSCLTVRGGETPTSSESELDDNFEKPDFGKTKKVGSLVVVDGSTELELETLLKASAYILGASGSSIVYKAVLEDGTALAVRRIGDCAVERIRDFEARVRSVAKIRHPNLTRVRGFYWGEDEKLLIHDFVDNGSLAAAGGGNRKNMGSSPCHMSLEVRLKIARGVARGLAHVHEKKHVHGHVKPSNILLTSEMEPIISDLGLDRLVVSGTDNTTYYKPMGSAQLVGSHRPTGSRDTLHDLPAAGSPYVRLGSSGAGAAPPYQPPEALKSLEPGPKWDVYAFGVVLLELLTGRVVSESELAQWAGGSAIEDGDWVLRLADVAIRGDVESRREVVVTCFKLGFGCASMAPQKRPTMKEALQALEKVQC